VRPAAAGANGRGATRISREAAIQKSLGVALGTVPKNAEHRRLCLKPWSGRLYSLRLSGPGDRATPASRLMISDGRLFGDFRNLFTLINEGQRSGIQAKT
jgi:hypothetical protein